MRIIRFPASAFLFIGILLGCESGREQNETPMRPAAAPASKRDLSFSVLRTGLAGWY